MKTERKFKLFNVFDKDEIVLGMNESYTDKDGDTCEVVRYEPGENKLWIAINGHWHNTFGEHEII